MTIDASASRTWVQPGAEPAAAPPLKASEHISLSAYWLATNLHWGALLLIIIPSQMKQIAPDWKAQATGWILGSGAVLAMVMPIIAGAMSDRCASRWGRRRPFMAAGVLVNLFGLGILWQAGTTRSFWLYLVGYLVVQLGNGTASGAYSGVIPDVVPENQRGTASGYMAVMSQSGTMLGAVGGGYLMSHGHVALAYLAIGAALVLFVSVTMLGMNDRPAETDLPPFQWRVFLKSLWIDPRQYPDFAWVWITRALVTMGMWMVQPFILYYLADVIHEKNPEGVIAKLLGAILIGATVTGLIGGSISDRVGRKRVVYVANSIIAVASVALLFARTFNEALWIGLIYGLGYGAYYSVDWALGCDVLPNKADAAKDMGVWHISMTLPQSLAAPLAGALLGLFSRSATGSSAGTEVHYALGGYMVIFSLAALFLILAAVLVRNVRGVR